MMYLVERIYMDGEVAFLTQNSTNGSRMFVSVVIVISPGPEAQTIFGFSVRLAPPRLRMR